MESEPRPRKGKISAHPIKSGGDGMKKEAPINKAYRMIYPKLVVLVSCMDPETGKPNIITVAWSVPLSINPPLVGILVAPKRYSHELISKSNEFVVNIPSLQILDKAINCGMVSGRQHDKFSEFGLTPEAAKIVKTPIIKECVAHLECRLVAQHTTGDHTLFVGKVVAAYADDGIFDGEFMNIEKSRQIYQVGGNFFTTLNGKLYGPQ